VTTETARERRARWLLRALHHKGVLHFPPSGWPGWDEEQIEQARRDLEETIQDVSERVPLDVETRENGTVVVRAHASLN
jgi:hypothetical protein